MAIAGWLTVKEAAKKYKYSEEYVRRLIRKGKLEVKWVGVYLISEQSFQDYTNGVTMGRPPKEETAS